MLAERAIERGRMRALCRVVGADHAAGHRSFSRARRIEWKQADLRGWADHPHQSVWDDLLLAGGPARDARGGGAAHAFAGYDLHAAGPRGAAALPSASRCSRCTGISSMRCGSWFSPWCTSWEGRAWRKQHSNSNHKAGRDAAHGETIHLPAPTAWPIVLAFGCTLAAAGLVTNRWVISILGGVLMLAGCIGWFRAGAAARAARRGCRWSMQPVTIATSRALVERIELRPEHRAHLPVETYPVTSGIKGGIAGGVRDDCSGAGLRTDRAAQHLVSGESAGRRGRGATGAIPPLRRSRRFTGRACWSPSSSTP